MISVFSVSIELSTSALLNRLRFDTLETTKLGDLRGFQSRGLLPDYGMSIPWVVPPPRMPVANEGLVRDPHTYKCNNPGGDCYWEGGRPNLYLFHFAVLQFGGLNPRNQMQEAQ